MRKIVVISLVILDVLACIFLFFTYGPIDYFRNLLITTAMTTKSHHYLAKTLYEDETIYEVMDSNYMEEVNENTDLTAININNIEEKTEYDSIYEEQILSREEGYDLKDTFAGVVADRVLDTFPFIVLAAITIVAMLLYFEIPTWLVVVLVLSVIGILVVLGILIYLCINPSFGSRLEKFIFRIVNRFYKKSSEELEKSIHDNIFGFQKTMSMLILNKRLMFYTIPLSFLIWVFLFFWVYNLIISLLLYVLLHESKQQLSTI